MTTHQTRRAPNPARAYRDLAEFLDHEAEEIFRSELEAVEADLHIPAIIRTERWLEAT